MTNLSVEYWNLHEHDGLNFMHLIGWHGFKMESSSSGKDSIRLRAQALEPVLQRHNEKKRMEALNSSHEIKAEANEGQEAKVEKETAEHLTSSPPIYPDVSDKGQENLGFEPDLPPAPEAEKRPSSPTSSTSSSDLSEEQKTGSYDLSEKKDEDNNKAVSILLKSDGSSKRSSKEAIVVFAKDAKTGNDSVIGSLRGPCVLIPDSAFNLNPDADMIFKAGEKPPLERASNKVFDEKSALRDAMFLASKGPKDYLPDDESIISTKDLESGAPERQVWDNPIEFLLSCIAMSVGLGNVWRFPFTAYENGGGAFLIPYIIVLMLIGRPMYFMELALGQFTSRSSVQVWDMVPALRGIGYGQALANGSVISYYTCLIAIAVHYLYSSFTTVLPWTVCDPNIVLNNTVCIPSGANKSQIIADKGLDRIEMNVTSISAAEQYFIHNVLHEKPNIEDGLGLPNWQLTICLAICYLLLFLTLWKGVSGSGKVAYFTAIFPYVVLFTLLGRGVTLPGAYEGIMFYIRPDFMRLLDFKVWYAAVTQSFFSLSVGFGSLITYSSFNKFNHNTYRDALIISVMDTFTSLLAGFTIFSVLGNLAFELDQPVEKVIKSGTGLAFISYPMAIGKFTWYPQVFSVLFFLMLITLGMGSSTGLLQGLIGIICDANPNWNKSYVCLGSCIFMFLVGLVYVTPGGQHILLLVDALGGGMAIFLLAILEMVGINWVYGLLRFIRDISFMLKRRIGLYWMFCWGFFIPIALAAIFGYSVATFSWLEYAGVPLPANYMYVGFGLVGVAIAMVPLCFVSSVFMAKGESCTEKILAAWKPNDTWGPKNSRDRMEWLRQESDFQMEQALR